MSKPLVEAMIKYLRDEVYPFHTPGHKGGCGLGKDMLYLLQHAPEIDVSLMDELDDLHSPNGVIAQGQDLAARLYGSDACFWCVNGTTMAVQAMVLSTLHPGDRVLVARNSHLSVYNALILAGAEPVYVLPQYNYEFEIFTQVTPEAVAAALKDNSGVNAVIITSPNYYGVAADVAGIADVCHQWGIPLLVDEAHGAHLGFSEKLPKGALRQGADLVAQSTHKVLGAMTQASMLHVKSTLVPVERVRDIMGILTTTSPNYLLMASLDAAREQYALQGEELAERTLAAADKLRRVMKLAGFRCLEPEDVAPFALDTGRVLVNLKNMDSTGPELAAFLRKHRVAVELADIRNVLFLVTYGDDNPRYYDVLMELRKLLVPWVKKHRVSGDRGSDVGNLVLGMKALNPARAFAAAKEQVDLSRCVGRISGEMVSVYPPGVPVLLPGERITREVAAYLQEQSAAGLVIKGAADASLQTLKVLV